LQDFFFFLSSSCPGLAFGYHNSGTQYVWSWTIRRKEKEMPLRELRSPLRGTPQAIGTYSMSEVIQKKSETYQRFLSFDSSSDREPANCQRQGTAFWPVLPFPFSFFFMARPRSDS
jgi:hypothetical protein